MSHWLPNGVTVGRVEVGHSDEPVDRATASSQVIEPARQQDREAAVAIDVARCPDLAGHERMDPIVERDDEVLDQATRNVARGLLRRRRSGPAARPP